MRAQIFACLIFNCYNIYKSLQIHVEKSCFSRTTAPFGSGEVSLESTGQKKLIFCVYPKFSSKISLAISLHDWSRDVMLLTKITF